MKQTVWKWDGDFKKEKLKHTASSEFEISIVSITIIATGEIREEVDVHVNMYLYCVCIYFLKSELFLEYLQQVEWSVTVMVIVLMTSPMERVWDSLEASASVQWKRFITQKQGYGRRSGRLVACLLMKVV